MTAGARVVTTADERPLTATWAALQEMDLTALEPRVRARIGEAWTRDALFEHASIASFSRFSLHLQAVAAPPHLLELAHRAALDEIHHARLCFALASAYRGEPVGPGPLPLGGDLLGSLDLLDITLAAVVEGCVGETLASLDAASALELVTEPACREALTLIAEDEARHAELAWKFVRWAVDTGGPRVHDAVARTFRDALSHPAPAPAPEDPDDLALARHGRLSDQRKQASMRDGLADVVRPAALLLLGQTSL